MLLNPIDYQENQVFYEAIFDLNPARSSNDKRINDIMYEPQNYNHEFVSTITDIANRMNEEEDFLNNLRDDVSIEFQHFLLILNLHRM